MLRRGQTVIVHRRNNPVELIRKLWEESDLASVKLEAIWKSLWILGATGTVHDIDDKNNVYVQFKEYGLWCLKESMLDAT